MLDDNYVYYNHGTGSEGTGTGHWYPFDITEAVKDWKNNKYGGSSNHYGIMLKACSESNGARTFGTNNHSFLDPNVVAICSYHGIMLDLESIVHKLVPVGNQ